MWNHEWLTHWALSLWVHIIISRVELTRLYVFVMYNFLLWMSILVYFFVWVLAMHICVRITIRIILVWVLVMHISVRMTIHIILLWVFVMHIFVRMTIHIILVWVFVMHISVRMNIYIILVWISSCTSLYEWLSIQE